MDPFYIHSSHKRRGPRRRELMAEKILELTNIGAGVLIFTQLTNLTQASFFLIFSFTLIVFYAYWYIIYKL